MIEHGGILEWIGLVIGYVIVAAVVGWFSE